MLDRCACAVLVLAATALGSVGPQAPHAAVASDAGPDEPRAAIASEVDPTRARPLLGRRDLWFGVATGAAILAAASNDRWLTEESTESGSPGERRIARAAQPLGNVAVVVPALAIAYGAGRVTGRPGLSRAAVGIGLSIAASGSCAFALKEAVGRARPEESPGDASSLQPFSGHKSFPSGHAAIAFAAATALTQETSSNWVPWIAYPAAAVVGWSRVHDDAHWTSDVVAGAALGTWTAWKVERMLHERRASGSSLNFSVWPSAGGARMRLNAAF